MPSLYNSIAASSELQNAQVNKRLHQGKNLSGAPSVKTGINHCSQRFWFLRKVERQREEGITRLQTWFFSEPDFVECTWDFHGQKKCRKCESNLVPNFIFPKLIRFGINSLRIFATLMGCLHIYRSLIKICHTWICALKMLQTLVVCHLIHTKGTCRGILI